MKTDSNQEFDVRFSDRAIKRGSDLIPIYISEKEQIKMDMMLAHSARRMEDAGLFANGDIHLFLGYCNYYLFHENYLLAFMNGWVFIEALIEMVWTKEVKNKSNITGGREWTAFIQIEELFMFNIIDETIRTDLNKLRKKRNAVFHVDEKPAKRVVESKDANDCFKVSWQLLNILLGAERNKILYFKDLRGKFFEQIHRSNQKTK
jgi:hypothetical protein